MSDPDRGPDLRGPAVIVDGSVQRGFKFIGPFENIEAASLWHQERSLPGVLRLPCTIVLLLDPEQEAVITKTEES